MPSTKNLTRITMLLLSLVTNYSLEHGDNNNISISNRALAATMSPGECKIINSAITDARLKDFHSEPGIAFAESTGIINLAWTAPGDDADSGRIDHYVIKYSNDPLSEANWNQAFVAPNPPAPLDAGSPQAYVLTNLENGRRYYIAVKSYDESGNVSPISNVVNTFASGIMAPTLVGAAIDSANNAVSLYANPVDAPMSVFYEFALDSLPNFPEPLIDVDLVIDSLVSVSFTQLRGDIVYYWRCRAVAVGRADSSAWSASDSFLIYDIDVTAPVVTVSSPNGGENLEVGSAYTVRWDCGDNIGVNACRVEYSADNGDSWIMIQDWADHHDSLSWVAPALLSTQCLMRISARDGALNIGSDTSDAVFTIDDDISPTVSIHNPVVDDSITMGWNAFDNGIITHYLIDYTSDGGQNWIPVSSGPGGDSGAVTMPIPGQIPAIGIRVTCFDMAENAGADTFTVIPTSIGDDRGPVPSAYYLKQSYPNPFNPSTTIEYGLPNGSQVTIEVFDITGAIVALLKNEYQEAGKHSVTWNAGDVASGTYFYRIAADGFSDVGKAILMK